MSVSPLTAAMSKSLFDAVRIIKGRDLIQSDVDAINRALMVEVAAVARSGMRASQVCKDLIHSFETFQANAYKDPGSSNGLPITCGWGSTRDLDGKPIKLGALWTREYADAVFARDLAEFEQGVNLLLRGMPTTQNQFDALVSFAYNVGLDIDDDTTAEGLGDSSLLKHHVAGRFDQARAAFGSWIYNDGKKLNGLVRRRAEEANLYGRG